MVRDKPLRTSWGKKMAAKQEQQLVKKFSLQLKQDKAKEKEVWIRSMKSNPCYGGKLITNLLKSIP